MLREGFRPTGEAALPHNVVAPHFRQRPTHTRDVSAQWRKESGVSPTR